MDTAQQKYSFRQFLIPVDHQEVKIYKSNSKVINNKVFQAVGDLSQPPAAFSLNQKIIDTYKKLGFIIRPDNLYLLAWQFVIICIILFYILELGMLIAFGQTFWNDELNNFVAAHILFILMLSADILLSPLKSYYDEGILIIDVSAIYRNYLQLQLWIDLAGLLSIVVPIAVGSLESNWIKLLILLKIYTMTKINIQLERLTQLNITISTIYLVLKLIVFCYIYGHYMGIGFYLVSVWVYNNNYYGPNTPNLCWCYNAWAFYQMQLILTWPQMYIYIMYYSMAVVTTIAYGDITPKNPLECIYTIFALITVTLIFGYLMTQIMRLLINVFSYYFSRKFVHDQLILKLKNQHVQQSIQIQFRTHTNQIDREEQFRNRSIQEKIMNFLPSEPLYGLLAIIYESFLKEIGFKFIDVSGVYIKPYDCKSLFLEKFMKEIKEERHFIGDILYHRGQTDFQNANGHNVYYYTKPIYEKTVILGVGEFPAMKGGKIQKLSKSKKNSFQLRRSKKIFGEVQFLTGKQRNHWAFCGANCVLFVASRSALLNCYPLLTQTQKQVVFAKMDNPYQQNCLFCQGNHLLTKCYYVFFNTSPLNSFHSNVNRTKSLLKNYETKLKKQSTWSIYKKIKDIKIIVTKEYKDNLLLNKANHSLFMEYQLDQQNEDDRYEEHLYQTEVMVEKIYQEFLIEKGRKTQNMQYDKIYQYKRYKPYNNIEKIIQDIKSKSSKKNNIN